MSDFELEKKDDRGLISDYLNGQAEALPYLIDRHLKSIYRFIFSLVQDESVAEDLTQDVFVKAWKKLKSYNPEYSFKTWLFTITRNTTTDYLRKRKDLVFSDFDDKDDNNLILDTLADDSLLADEIFAHTQDLNKLNKVLKNMPSLYKEVLILKYSNDLSLEEISIVLKRPIETVKSQHRRGLLHLKELFSRII